MILFITIYDHDLLRTEVFYERIWSEFGDYFLRNSLIFLTKTGMSWFGSPSIGLSIIC